MTEDVSESRESKPFDGNDLIASTMVVADPAKPIRIGSPFAVDPVLPKQPKKVEVLYDVGPLRYTAMGAVSASAMVVGFGLVAAFWFPSGGALIAALGCVLSIFGMYSNFRYVAAGLLVAHLGLFVVNYVQSLA
jgi:hypothetical protein